MQLRRFEAFQRVFWPFERVLGVFLSYPVYVCTSAYGEDFWHSVAVASSCCWGVSAAAASGEAQSLYVKGL